jgi:hypothetical protein
MLIPSNKSMVMAGFLLSLISVVVNSFVLSYTSNRLKAVDDEYSSLAESLDRQAAALNEGDSQFDHYRIMHNLAFAVTQAKTADARRDAENFLKTSLTRYYAAAHDISQTEITNMEVEEIGQALPLLEKGLALGSQLQTTTDPAKRAQLTAELEALSKQAPQPKSELARKLQEVQKYAQAEYADSEVMLYSALLPVMKSLREQVVNSSDSKHARMRELVSQRATLIRRMNYSSYAAVALQLFGLMFILAKDLLKER